MSSRPLFISVAESIVILPPMAHVGWRSASSTVTPASSARVRPRNGPPLAVRTSLSTVPARSPSSSWWIAECSESTGTIRAPVASASWVTRSPPTTSDSLLASARSMPSPSVATVGPRPAEPTSALSTRSAPDSMTSRTSPSGPVSTSPSVHASAARAPASMSATAMRSTPVRSAWATSASQERSALRPTSSRSSERSTTSSAWVPMDPVDPRTRRRREDTVSLEQGPPQPVADDDREQQRVEPVQRPAVRAEQAAGVLDPRVALDVALEEVPHGPRQRHADADEQRVRPAQPVLVGPGEPHAEDADDDPDAEALPRLRRRHPRREGRRAERAPAEVRADVAGDGPDEDARDDAAPVGQVAQEHRVSDRDADPRHAEHAERQPRPRRARRRQRHGEQHGEERDEREHHRVHVAELRGDDQADDAEEPRELRRSRVLVERQQLVHADEPEEPDPGGEPPAAGHDDRDRERDRGHAEDDPRPEVRAAHQRPPKRRRRSPYSASAASNAARSKSGHSSSRNTSSEYADCHMR